MVFTRTKELKQVEREKSRVDVVFVIVQRVVWTSHSMTCFFVVERYFSMYHLY